MKAIAERYGIGEAAVLAVAAGCDVVLVCRGEDGAGGGDRPAGPGGYRTGLRSGGRWRRRRFGRGGFGRGRRRRNVVGRRRGRWGRHGIGCWLRFCGRLGKVPGEHLRTVDPVILEKVEEDPAQVEARLLVIDPFEERRRIAVRPFPPPVHRRLSRVVRRHRPEIVPPVLLHQARQVRRAEPDVHGGTQQLLPARLRHLLLPGRLRRRPGHQLHQAHGARRRRGRPPGNATPGG